jgi:arylsulfatase A
MRTWLHLGAAVVAALASTPTPAAGRPAEDRPNIVILFCDDAGYGDFSVNGAPAIATPQLERMSREGMRFTQFYSASAACSASRYALMTGRYPARSGFGWVLGPGSKIGIHSNEVTLAEALRERGYATAAFGKWHLGVGADGIDGIENRHEFLPLQNGFDVYFGIPYSNDMKPCVLVEGNAVVERDVDQRTLTRRYTERAAQFIRAHRDDPFLLYLPYAMPHLPLNPGEEFAGRSRAGTYGDVIEEIDDSVGRVLDALRAGRIDTNTLVVFSSDNGPWQSQGRLRAGSSGPFRDSKGSTWEGGVRVPGLAWWPGTVPAGAVCRDRAATVDLFTTAVRLAGATPPAGRTIDGRDIRPLLLGRGSLPDTPWLYYGLDNKLFAVRKGPWKLHIATHSQMKTDHGWPGVSWEKPLLFDLERDPSETTDLAGENAAIVADLKGDIEKHRQALAAEGTFWKTAAPPP